MLWRLSCVTVSHRVAAYHVTICAACVLVFLQDTAEYMSPEVLKALHPTKKTGSGLGWVLLSFYPNALSYERHGR
jgi:hypothetical protein